jgi:hypothetical protein
LFFGAGTKRPDNLQAAGFRRSRASVLVRRNFRAASLPETARCRRPPQLKRRI